MLKSITIYRFICKYYNGCFKIQLLNLYVGIAYFKWPYGNYNRKDVDIA
jgi:hypothetical protein